MVGERLGPYEILAPIGSGGMGEVYKALDTRLNRTVAVKVLPAHIVGPAAAQARFEREARVVASLNHPHICTLFDIGPGYMVMELIAGETLAAKIEHGAIPLEQALVWAGQIADALDRAHRAGVTHRDVKPGNIMLTRDGVKVLDFGLAKEARWAKAPEETLTQDLTASGVLVGTPQYMSPEQFAGNEADARADIWAFGAVLYEMVAGRKAFAGKNYSSLVGAILSANPAPLALAPFTPAWLERLVRRCLAKDPEDRWQSMRDIVLELRMTDRDMEVRAKRVSRWPWAAAAAGVGIVALAWMWPRSDPGAPVKLEVTPPWGSHFAAVTNVGGSAISPDGRTLAYVVANAKGETLLHVRPLDLLESRALPGTEEAGRPFWSPDGKSLGFVAQGKLKRTDIAGGLPLTLCDAVRARGGAWNDDGVILFGDAQRGLQTIPAAGGTPAPATRLDDEAGEIGHYYPQFLPGGRRFIYLALHDDESKNDIWMGTLDGTAPARILHAPYKAEYDANAKRLLYAQGTGMLIAQGLELDPPRLVKDPATVAEGLAVAYTNGYAEFSIAKNGTLFYGRGSAGKKMRFRWRDRAGAILEGTNQSVESRMGFSLSPDGRSVAFESGSTPGQTDIWVMELARGLNSRITSNGGRSPRWSADGKLVYYSNRSGICRKSADGSGEEELLLKVVNTEVVQSVSPDGKNLLFGNSDVMILPLEGERRPTAYIQPKNGWQHAAFSPDGRWVAYISTETGQREVYIQGFPERRGKWQVSTGAGGTPYWRADGKELFWFGRDNTVMGVKVELRASEVRTGQQETLFPLIGQSIFFQPGLDGRRILVYEPESGQQEWPKVVQLHWAAGIGK